MSWAQREEVKNLLIGLSVLMSMNVYANESNIISEIRELFRLPEIVSSRTFEVKSDFNFREGTKVKIHGHKVIIRSRTKMRRPIGKCILIQKTNYSNGEFRYSYRGRCKKTD